MRHLSVLPVLFLLACGGFDGSATQKLELKRGDVEAGLVSVEKELDSANSTWDQFLKDAKADLGADPTALEITSAKLQFDATKSKNVGKFEDVFTGKVTVFFKIKDSSEIIEVAEITAPKGTGDVELDLLTTDLSAKAAKLKAGQFKIGVKGATAKTKDDDFELGVVAVFSLTAT